MDQNQLCLGIKKSCLGYSAACYRLSFRTKRETLHQCIYARTLKRLISLHCYLIDKKHEVLRKSSLIGSKLFLKSISAFHTFVFSEKHSWNVDKKPTKNLVKLQMRTLKRLISLHCYLIDKKTHEVLRKSSLIGSKLFLKSKDAPAFHTL